MVLGQKGMPPFGAYFDDDQVAAVVGYVRTHFGNSYAAPVTAAEVKVQRPAPGGALDWVRCIRCSGPLNLMQPDNDSPERLLGVCETCDCWALIELVERVVTPAESLEGDRVDKWLQFLAFVNWKVARFDRGTERPRSVGFSVGAGSAFRQDRLGLIR